MTALRLFVCLVVLSVCLPAVDTKPVATNDTKYNFNVFDVPGAYATIPRSINSSGVVCGVYTTTVAGPFHGFIRQADGTITKFDFPGSAFTLLTGVNASGVVAGFWAPNESGMVEHGFLRDPTGNVTQFDVPGYAITAVNGVTDLGTILVNALQEPGPAKFYLRNVNGDYAPVQTAGVPSAVNNAGVFIGNVGPQQAFIADPHGQVTEFHFPGSTTSTVANGINDSGAVVGSWNSGQGYAQRTHAFVRRSDGTFEELEAPGAKSTAAFAINNAGSIAGSYMTLDQRSHGFIALPEVSAGPSIFTTFDVPGAYATYPSGINAEGSIVGYYRLQEGAGNHAFVRDAKGNFTTFDVPGSAMSTARGINDSGLVVGDWSPDLTGNVEHIFLREPTGLISSFDVPGFAISSAWAVNNVGAMTVNALTEPGPNKPQLRSPSGTYAPIAITGLTAMSLTSIDVYGMNNLGVTTACATQVGGAVEAVVIPANSTAAATAFTAPNSSGNTCAYGINEQGTTVGYYTQGYRGGESSHAFARAADGTFAMFDMPGALGTTATAINAAGWITGNYDDPQGRTHGFLLAPVRQSGNGLASACDRPLAACRR